MTPDRRQTLRVSPAQTRFAFHVGQRAQQSLMGETPKTALLHRNGSPMAALTHRAASPQTPHP